MKLKFLVIYFFFPFSQLHAQEKDSVSINLSTPEDALISFDNCMLRKDLNAALQCKDFSAETALFIKQSEINTTDTVYIKSLEEEIKQEFLENFKKYKPNTSGIRARHFPEKQNISSSLVLLREIIIFKNQVIISQHYYISKDELGTWKVLNRE